MTVRLDLDASAPRGLLSVTMSLGTKNRLTHNATHCREHLRTRHPDKLVLVSKEPRSKLRGINSMILQIAEKPKQASGYQTQWE